jgi:hypothetical protein
MDASARRSPAQTVSQERLMPQEAPPPRTPGLPNLPAPPPPSGGALAWLRWTITMLKASTGRNRAAIRRHHAPTGITESLGTVAIAIGTDLAMSVAKAVAAALTGSAGLFAETLHSLADTGNQLLLLKGLRGTRRRPDSSHPFGYGAELFYWSLLAALSIFIVGGVLSIWEGTQRLLHPSEVQVALLAFAVLGLGCLLDGTSWLTSVRQLRQEATARGVPLRQHIRSTTDTAVTAVYYEDAAALLGNAIALTGLGIAPAPWFSGARCCCQHRDRPAAGCHRAAAGGTKPRAADQPLGLPGRPGPHPGPARRRP